MSSEMIELENRVDCLWTLVGDLNDRLKALENTGEHDALPGIDPVFYVNLENVFVDLGLYKL